MFPILGAHKYPFLHKGNWWLMDVGFNFCGDNEQAWSGWISLVLNPLEILQAWPRPLCPVELLWVWSELWGLILSPPELLDTQWRRLDSLDLWWAQSEVWGFFLQGFWSLDEGLWPPWGSGGMSMNAEGFLQALWSFWSLKWSILRVPRSLWNLRVSGGIILSVGGLLQAPWIRWMHQWGILKAPRPFSHLLTSDRLVQTVLRVCTVSNPTFCLQNDRMQGLFTYTE